MSTGSRPLSVVTRDGDDPDAIVLELEGDLVVTSQDPMRAAVEAKLTGGRGRIVLECARLSHVDMAGFALLYRLHERCVAAGGGFVLAAMPEEFREVARSLHLDEHIPFTESVAAGIDALAR